LKNDQKTAGIHLAGYFFAKYLPDKDVIFIYGGEYCGTFCVESGSYS
jgi:hypothetical protein